MIVDCLLAADAHLGISKRIDHPEQYLYLTDSILEEIERSTAPELSESRELLLRIRKRDLYRFVDVRVVPGKLKAHWKNQVHFPAELSHAALLDTSSVNFGFGALNPLAHIRFYGKDPNSRSSL